MASTASSAAPSTASTPSITVTSDEDEGTAATNLNALDYFAAARPKSLHFEVPTTEEPTRPAPSRATSSDVTITTPEVPSIASIVAETKSSDKSPTKKPLLKKETSSIRLFTDFRKNLSASNLLHHGHKHGGNSGSSSTTPQTPEMKELLQQSTCPDLDSVNRALESLRHHSAPESDPLLTKLRTLAARMHSARCDGKKALTDAMRARDRGCPEICRAHCLSIVHNPHAEADTMVYAYNILSTQASPGQAVRYLAEAWRVVQAHEGKRGDCGKLFGVIAVLKEGAVARDAGDAVRTAAETGAVAEDDDDESDVKDLLPIPEEHLPSGAMTPRTEKILAWSEPEPSRPASR